MDGDCKHAYIYMVTNKAMVNSYRCLKLDALQQCVLQHPEKTTRAEVEAEEGASRSSMQLAKAGLSVPQSDFFTQLFTQPIFFLPP